MDGERLLESLRARSGLVCTVGAGGKKSTLRRLAEAHGGRVGLTATVLTPTFPRDLQAHVVVADDDDLLEAVRAAARSHRRVAFAHPSRKRARLRGLAPERIGAIHAAAAFDVTLIKADGARARGIKAPGADEPVIPRDATSVIPVVSAHVIGRPLTAEIAHRVDRIEAVTGLRPGETIRAEHVARLLTHPEGALKRVGAAAVTPLINMVDDEALEAAAREAAERALALTRRFARIVLGRMRATDPFVAVVERGR